MKSCLPRRGYVLQPKVAVFGGYLGKRKYKPATATRLRPAWQSHVPATYATALRLNFARRHPNVAEAATLGWRT